jgi:hypothetical protein
VKNDIQGLCVDIPIPLDLYIGLINRLRKLEFDLHDTKVNSGQQSSNATESARDWSNDRIVFGAPTAIAEGKAPRSGKNSTMPLNNDWCIGCGCPSEDLLS